MPRPRGIRLSLAALAAPVIAVALLAIAVTPASAAPRTYTVQPGDTLLAIAARHDVNLQTIMQANGIADADHVQVGQELMIPSRGWRQMGTSVQGRAIEVHCFGTGERLALFVGGIHTGHEAVTVELAREMARLAWLGRVPVHEGLRLCIIPELNPDGLALGTRVNANDVDLNRNWPTQDWNPVAFHSEDGEVSGGVRPLSEPETRALYDYVVARRPDVVVVWHCCGAVVEPNPHGRAFADAYASGADLRVIEQWNLYPITGELLETMRRIGVPAIDVEMTRADDMALADHHAGVLAVLRHLAMSGTSASASEAPAEPAGSPASVTYTIQPGDTLAGIAARWSVSLGALALTNELSAPYRIYAGRSLTIPR
jgi:murein peptide amidase A